MEVHARALAAIGQHQRAEKLLREVVNIRSDDNAQHRPACLASRCELLSVVLGHHDGDSLAKEATALVADCRQALGERHPTTARAVEILERLAGR
jgi:hypothetical protein